MEAHACPLAPAGERVADGESGPDRALRVVVAGAWHPEGGEGAAPDDVLDLAAERFHLVADAVEVAREHQVDVFRVALGEVLDGLVHVAQHDGDELAFSRIITCTPGVRPRREGDTHPSSLRTLQPTRSLTYFRTALNPATQDGTHLPVRSLHLEEICVFKTEPGGPWR